MMIKVDLEGNIMPLKKCSSGGKSGTKYGDSGKCYTGKSGKAMAIKQMKAMYASGYKGSKKK